MKIMKIMKIMNKDNKMKKSTNIQKRLSRVVADLEKLAINVPENLAVDKETNQEADLKELRNLLNSFFKYAGPLQQDILKSLKEKIKSNNIKIKNKHILENYVEKAFNQITDAIHKLMVVQNTLKNK